jgi:hypothetical protein
MKIALATFLIVYSIYAYAGGSSEPVQLLSLTETQDHKYTLKYKSTNSEKIYTIYLSYNKLGYLLQSKFLSQEKYDASIALLKKQLKNKIPVRFGWFGGGPCVVNKNQLIYRSDALDIYIEKANSEKMKVVYAFCEYR